MKVSLGARRSAPLIALLAAALLLGVPSTGSAAASRWQGPPGNVPSGTASSDRLTERPVGTTRSPLGYVEYLPPGYDARDRRREAQPPLLVFLHGYGESGAGTADELPLLYATGIPQLIAEDRWPASRPFVVLAPQNPWETDDSIYDGCLASSPAFLGSCLMRAQHDNDHPPDAAYCFTPDEVHAFIRFAVHHYHVDPRRIYVTGLSCGGFATWEYASEHPHEAAAVVPIAGEGRPAWDSAGCRLAAVPVWAFHGLLDDTVNPQGSVAPVAHLRHCRHSTPLRTRLTVYPTADHDQQEPWTRTYDLSAGHDIYRWMLRFHIRTPWETSRASGSGPGR